MLDTTHETSNVTCLPLNLRRVPQDCAARPDRHPPARRIVAFALIVVLHVAFIYAIASMRAPAAISSVTQDVKVTFIDEQRPEQKPPPPQPVQMMPSTSISLPQVQIDIPTPVDEPVIQASASPPQSTEATQSTEPTSAQSSNGLEPSESTPPSFVHPVDLQKYYPRASKRQGEQGSVAVQVCVSASGREQSFRILTSSGYGGIDQAAVDVIRDNPMKPGTYNGRPVDSCGLIMFQFQLPR